VIRLDGVVTSAGGEVTPGREKGGNDVSWADRIFLGQKMKKIYVIDLVASNGY
jgi:hypothetical protein